MATYYWVGGSGTWDNTSNTNWASSSGGAGGAGVPNNTDTVIFDSNSGTAATVTVTSTATCAPCTINKSDINLNFTGNATIGASGNTVTLTAGTITLNSYTLSCGQFNSNNSNARAINFGTGAISIANNGTTVYECSTLTGMTYSGSKTVNFTYSGSTGTRSVANGTVAGASAANAINVNVTAGTDGFACGGGSAINNLTLTGWSGTLNNQTTIFYGDVTMSTGGSFAAGANAVTFAGTTLQKITTNGKTWDAPLTFNGVGGTFQLQDNLTMGSTRTATLTNGTLDLTGNSGNWTLSCGLFASSNSNVRSIKFGTGNITLTGNNTGIWNLATATNFTYTGTPTVNSTYSGSTGSRTFSHGSTAGLVENNAVTLNITAGTDTIAFTANNGFANINFTGFAGTFSNAAFSIYGNLTLSTGMTVADGASTTTFASASGTQTITSNGKTYSRPINIGSATAFPTVELADALNTGTRAITVIAGTFDTKGYNVTCGSFATSSTTAYTKSIKLNNSTVTISTGLIFYYQNSFTFNAGTSSIVLTSATASFQLLYGQSYTFYNVLFTAVAAESVSFLFGAGMNVAFNNLSFANATTTSYNAIFTGGNITVNGTLTLPTGGSYINRVAFYSLDGTTINAAAISGTLTDVDFRGITVTGPTAPWTGTRLGDGGGNSGITGFATPKTVYWSLAAGGNWDATAWALTSNGTPAVANYPILGDTVIFDNAGLNTSATVTTNRAFTVNNIDFSARSNAMTFARGNVPGAVNGNFTASSAITFSGTMFLYIGNWSGTSTFTSAGRTISFVNRMSVGPSGNYVFVDNYTSTGNFVPASGNIDLNGKTFSIPSIQHVLAALKNINLNSAVITATGTSPFVNVISNGGYGKITYIGACTFNCSSASAKTVGNGAMTDLSGFTFVNTGAGALTFQNVVIPGFSDGQYGTYGDIQTTVRPATVNFTAGETFQFNNFTISGTSGNLVTLQSSTAGTRATLLSPNTVNSVSFCSIKDLNAVNTMGYGEWRAYTTNGNVDAGNNTGWLFSPATPSTAPRPTIRLRSLAQRGNMT